ncbi:uncharacterized protein LOC122245064 [Penaeus japonicus]|uniref:uncharacterized protein LOC122245064 n=1 Tax=Penaeus japonicus TaxID=27405 RepID=UPI001C710486|nr:uncharacterized protein LOC122245064 [Penaeus japonicus]
MKKRQRSKRKKMERHKELGPKAGQDAKEGDEEGGEDEKGEDKESIIREEDDNPKIQGKEEKGLDQQEKERTRGYLLIDEGSDPEKKEMNGENCTIKVEDTHEVLEEQEQNSNESQNCSLEWQNKKEENFLVQDDGREKAVHKISDKSDTCEPGGIGEEEELKKGIKEEVSSDESPVESPMSPMETSPSTSAVPQENVVAQLNQLQQTVVSHILQYQAGLQQQMLSQLSPGTPQTTSGAESKNSRKRPASSMSSADTREEKLTLADIHCKRKRTAFDQRQYQVLETTFEHNNFPEPIDQHCIALRIKTPYRSIKMWFQNRRASIRKRMSPKEKGVNAGEKTKNASDPDARWYCTLCPSTFISKRFLENHKEAHERETLYCPHCNMGFTHKVLLDTHKISKCSSKTGVDLTHLEDEYSNAKVTKKGKIQRGDKSRSSTLTAVNIQSALPLLMLQQLQKQQQEAKQDQNEEQHPIKKEKDTTLYVPPLLVAGTLAQKETSNQEEASQEQQSQSQLTLIQQRRLMQQLLLVQLQQAQKAQQKEDVEEDDSQQPASPNGSLTVGGLTIFPVKSSPSDEQKIKIEVKEEQENAVYSDQEDKQPSSLQDQITSILQSQGLKSLWKPTGVKTEPDVLDTKAEKRESMQEQINAILKNQEEIRKRIGKSNEEDSTDMSSMKRHRRRTTVFNEVQLRTLYMHFTYCNFPDPSMFKIIGHLTKLEPQVIKIWFQNERSRQRKRATHIVDEVNSKEKPYKCRDCGMSFAMLTFLVKHSMRHNGDTDQDEFVRTCPLCLQKWNKDVFASHLKSRHNVNLSLVEEKNVGNLMCYLCDEKFTDQESLMIHKHKHLKDDYGDPPECKECKTTFVNAICLEAHMETHRHKEWNYKCSLCGALFHDKILLDSHRMGHGVPLAPVSTIDRSRSQLQHTSVRAIHARARKTVASAITSLNTSMPEGKIGTEVKIDCSSPSSTVSSTPKSSPTSAVSSVSTILSPTLVTPSLINNQASSTINSIPFSSTQGPVSYVKLIPVQLIPVSSISGSQSNQKAGSLSTVTTAGITTPTTTFISVPVSLKGSTDANPILSQLLEPPSVQSKIESPAGLSKSNDKDLNCKNIKCKSLPNLIPIISGSSLPEEIKTEDNDFNDSDKGISVSECGEEDNYDIGKEREEEEESLSSNSETRKKAKKQIVNGVSSGSKFSIADQEDCRVSTDSSTGINTNNVKSVKVETQEQHNSGELIAHQVANTKRYVPILPMIPVELGSKSQAVVSNTETSALQRTRRTRNIPNKRLWQSFDPVGYKRRRTPTYFTGNQREILEAHFEHDNFPEPGEQMAIANHLGVDYAVVKTWFQNTRKNFRKQLKEESKYIIYHYLPCR